MARVPGALGRGRIRPEGPIAGIGVEASRLDFVDCELKSVHAGHICIARITLKRLTLTDSKTGAMDNKIRERRLGGDKSPEMNKLLKSKTTGFDLDLKANE